MILEIGETFDRRFVLRREVQHDEVSVLYQAHHLFTDTSVALRVVSPDAPNHAKARARLLREARLLGRIRHAGVVRVLDAGEDSQGEPYVAMEMLEGRVVDGLLAARGRLAQAEVAEVAASLVDALAAAHAAGIVHGELRPRCVFLPSQAAHEQIAEGTPRPVKIIDFGAAALAALRDEVVEAGGAPSGILEQNDYLAPEWLVGKSADARADIFSLSTLIYELLAGEPPTAATTQLSGPVADVLRRASYRDPEDRYEDIRAFGDALKQAWAKAPTLTQPNEGPARRRFPRAAYLTPVRIVRASGDTIDGRSEDISEGGMLILSPHVIEAKEDVEVRFALPISGDVIGVDAVARWVKGARDNKGAVGVEFKGLSEPARLEIGNYAKYFSGQ